MINNAVHSGHVRRKNRSCQSNGPFVTGSGVLHEIRANNDHMPPTIKQTDVSFDVISSPFSLPLAE